ncbi:hypothetical protein OB919_21460 [Halobacteria archaeon AArc-curdl1]|uniref:Halobacterial output domain-containing protein n=1 Tax=Natronosalvus hydrolyticus TaxID=2979988 RepID=A0AAP2ZCC3_9EURY|nr:hypothetical protein [Halobacteria archaeon AArc-curdl1]
MGTEVQYKPGADASPTTVIVETVADLTNQEAQNLPALYDSVDPDAVDQLFKHKGAQQLKLEFQYDGFQVTVDSSGSICLEETG